MMSLDHPDVDEWTEHRLAAADIVVNGVGFERKTPSDFASSITEGRMIEQAEKLADAYEHAYVLLDGEFAEFEALSHSRLNPQSMRGMAASLTARHGIPVIPCGTTGDLVDHAVRIGRKHTEEPVSDHLPTGPVGSDEPAGKRMWGCLPNVGPALADRLWDEFGAPAVFFRNYEGEWVRWLTNVDGIGESTAVDIVEAMAGGDSA
jgi:ERCC4-type nuclease